MIIPVIEPTTLSFITTDRCTALCHNCCFKCSPKHTAILSYNFMRDKVDEVINDFPALKVVVFTGGECTLLGENLVKIINYTHSKGLRTRIVSNGHWASTATKAKTLLKKLRMAGLNELNLSTGDEHQKWVSYNNIVYACVAAIELNLFVAINIESTRNSTFTSKNMLKDDRVSSLIAKGKFQIKDSLWIEFDKDSKQDYCPTQALNDGPCINLFNTIAISPFEELYACCGLTCEKISYLNLGSLKKRSIRSLYDCQFDDLMKLWLYTDGPKKIYKFLLAKTHNKMDESYLYPHICSLCKHILNNEEYLNIIRHNVDSIIPSILLKLHFINKVNLKSHEKD